MKKYQQKSLIAVLTGVLVFVVGSLVLLYFAGHKLAAAIQKDAKQIVNHIDAAVSERRQILYLCANK